MNLIHFISTPTGSFLLLVLAIVAILMLVELIARHSRGTFVGRMRTTDVDRMAMTFNSPAGFPGDISRPAYARVEPCQVDASAPPTVYGQIVVVDATTQGLRPLAAGDASNSVALTAYGALVRPYPAQQRSGGDSATFGSATPPTTGIIDALRGGYILGQVAANSTPPAKGGAVYVWCAASSGDHVQGGYETAASSGNTVLIGNATFQGGLDASNVAEIAFNV